MLNKEEGYENDHDPVEEDDEENDDKDAGGNRGNKNNRNIQRRTIITPLDMNILTNAELSRNKHISIFHLIQDPKLIQHKNYIHIIILCMISNKKSRGENKVQL